MKCSGGEFSPPLQTYKKKPDHCKVTACQRSPTRGEHHILQTSTALVSARGSSSSRGSRLCPDMRQPGNNEVVHTMRWLQSEEQRVHRRSTIRAHCARHSVTHPLLLTFLCFPSITVMLVMCSYQPILLFLNAYQPILLSGFVFGQCDDQLWNVAISFPHWRPQWCIGIHVQRISSSVKTLIKLV